jgi:hypothetical protein
MALETATRSNAAFAVAVEQVQSDLAAWRKRRKSREPIPELLWYDMAQSHGPANYNPLKRIADSEAADDFFVFREDGMADGEVVFP